MKFPKRLNGDSCGKTYMYLKECRTCQIRELELLVPTKTWSPCVKYHSSSSLPEIFMNSRMSRCASLGEDASANGILPASKSKRQTNTEAVRLVTCSMWSCVIHERICS